MAERPTTLFDPPAGDRPPFEGYQPGTWLAEPAPDGDQEGAPQPPPPTAGHRYALSDRRLLLDRLLEAERRLADRRAG
jgi:hypothetical protein